MTRQRLNIIETEEETTVSKRNRRDETRAKFDRIWLVDPTRFDPFRNGLERERIHRIKSVIQECVPTSHRQVVDLGCGWGVLSQFLAGLGASVQAVDISINALNRLKNSANITLIQDWVPNTKLPDESYDLVISTELIAYLHPDQYRLFFSEMARLVKSDGSVICSTALDIYSDDALERFSSLVDTEFKVEKWVLSYHSLYIKLRHFLKMPSKFLRAKKENEYRQKQLSKRKGFWHQWFKWNSQLPFYFFWKGMGFFISPLVKWLEQSESILLFMEKISKFVLDEKAISHVIFMGKRRMVMEEEPKEEIPIERKQRKQVWE